MARVFGEIPGIAVGRAFRDRADLSDAGVHKPTIAGISGSAGEGADSIVLNEGYEDDEDFGDIIVYTGHGGRDSNTGRQIADQQLERQNLALAVSRNRGLPVRVIRGPKLNSPYAPTQGYRYDGRYYVEDAWQDTGRAGYRIWRFRLVREDLVRAPWEQPPTVEPPPPPRRVETTVQRVVRDTAVARTIKELHDFRCQVCGQRLETPVGPYAEAAHIRPLGRPHEGPDVAENILCLCPNHHVLFDCGAFVVEDDLSLTCGGRLRTDAGHRISVEQLRYHREHYRAAEAV